MGTRPKTVPVLFDFSKNPKTKPVHIWATGDWHSGSLFHNSLLFTKHYGRAVAEKWVMIHVGDALEMVTPASRVATRGALREQIMEPEDQRRFLVAALKKIKDGCILPGNHEWRIDMATGLDFIASVTDAAPHIKPMLFPGIVQVKVGKQNYFLYVHHGEGPVMSVHTLFDRLQRDTEGLDAILCGHIHRGTFDAVIKDTVEGERTVLRFRTGHYLDRPMYARLRPTASIGAPGSWLLTLRPDEHRIDPTWLGQ